MSAILGQTRAFLSWRFPFLLVFGGMLSLLGVSARGDDTIPVGSGVNGVVLNPITNKIYVASSGALSEVSGEDHSKRVVAGFAPNGRLAVNAVTNKIFVATQLPYSIQSVDGETLASVAIPLPNFISGVAVNPVNDRVFATNYTDRSIWLIDGNTNQLIETLTATTAVHQIVVNPFVNKAYAIPFFGGSTTVYDGFAGTLTTVSGGLSATAAVVNPLTNKIYVSDTNSGRVTVIDGADDTSVGVSLGLEVFCVGVNPALNKIYAGAGFSDGFGAGQVSILDGATNAVVDRPQGCVPDMVSVNVAAGRTYVLDSFERRIYRIRGDTDSLSTFRSVDAPEGIVTNPITNRVYVGSRLGSLEAFDGTVHTLIPVPVAGGPREFVVNSVTNRAYVTHGISDRVTVVNGESYGTTQVRLGAVPHALDVDPVRRRVYVVSRETDQVFRIEEESLTVSSVSVGSEPIGLAVNPVTDKIYIINERDQTLSVLNGRTSSVIATVGTGGRPTAVAVNPATDRVYVANGLSDTVAVFDGSDPTNRLLVTAGANPQAIAVDSVSNRIYVVNQDANTVTVLDGTTHLGVELAVGTEPVDVSVNPSTDRAYVVNRGSDDVTVIEGDDLSTRTIAVGRGPERVAVNRASNKIYVTNGVDGDVTIIDGIDDSTRDRSVGANPLGIATDPVTRQTYVANSSSSTITGIDEGATGGLPMRVTVTPLPGDTSLHAAPKFEFVGLSFGSPIAPPILQVYYQVDTLQGEWTKTESAGRRSTATVESLEPGMHVLYAFATDGQESTSTHHVPNAGPHVGEIAAYPFLVDSRCGSGTVNAGAGAVVSVLKVNGESQVATVSPFEGFNVTLDSSPSGPPQGRYVLLSWRSDRSNPTDLIVMGERLGCSINPTAFDRTRGPQPRGCVLGSGIPASVCGSVSPLLGPATLPVSLTSSGGIPLPSTFFLQAILEDDGADNSLGFSLSNVVTLSVRP